VSTAHTVERQDITDTVRRERVEVDRDYRAYDRDQAGFRQHVDRRQEQGARWGGRTWEEAEPTYRYGYLAGRDSRYQGRRFEDVEADLCTDYQRRVGSTDDRSGWERLRAELREGWDRARG